MRGSRAVLAPVNNLASGDTEPDRRVGFCGGAPDQDAVRAGPVSGGVQYESCSG